jgi:hypothetical protein
MKLRMIREVVAAAALTLIVATPAMFAAREQAAQAARAGTPDLIGMLRTAPASVVRIDAISPPLH